MKKYELYTLLALLLMSGAKALDRNGNTLFLINLQIRK